MGFTRGQSLDYLFKFGPQASPESVRFRGLPCVGTEIVSGEIMKTENEIMVRTKSCRSRRVEKMPLVEMQDAFTRLITERKTDNEIRDNIGHTCESAGA